MRVIVLERKLLSLLIKRRLGDWLRVGSRHGYFSESNLYRRSTLEPARRHRSEQYFTCSQSRSHFLRQVKGREQCAQTLLGRSDFLRIFMTRL